MATQFDSIKDGFDGYWKGKLAALKPGAVFANVPPAESDGSIPVAEAKLLYRRFGALRDDILAPQRWQLDWRDKGPNPVLRLSPDLFEAVDGP